MCIANSTNEWLSVHQIVINLKFAMAFLNHSKRTKIKKSRFLDFDLFFFYTFWWLLLCWAFPFSIKAFSSITKNSFICPISFVFYKEELFLFSSTNSRKDLVFPIRTSIFTFFFQTLLEHCSWYFGFFSFFFLFSISFAFIYFMVCCIAFFIIIGKRPGILILLVMQLRFPISIGRK